MLNKMQINSVADITTAPSSIKKGRKRKAHATNSVVVSRTTRSKATHNDRKPRINKL
jgi:hypothetical protein